MESEKMNLLRSISTLTGTIIGVGFFCLPYVLSKIGIFFFFLYVLFLASLVVIIHLLFGELAVLTPDLRRLPGFAEYHLGQFAKKIALILALIGIYGTLLAYLIIGGNFLKNLFSPIFGGELIYVIVYFLLGSAFIFSGIKLVSKVDFLDVVLFSLILVLIFLFGMKFFNVQNLFIAKPKLFDMFLPYGPLLFSLWGTSIIPEVEEILKGRKENLKKAIFISIFISALFYFLFSVLVVLISGGKTSDDAISSLQKFLGREISIPLFLFGTITTFTSFISLGLTLKKVFWYDLKMGENLSWFLTCFPPLILYFLGFNKFLLVISFIGSVCLGMEGILILLMYKKKFKEKISRSKNFLINFLFLILILGIIFQLRWKF